MPLALLIALQLRTAAMASVADAVPHRPPVSAEDSARAVRAIQGAQAGFERRRRSMLPLGGTPSGRCDVRVGRFCWWYDDADPVFPPEPAEISRARRALITALDETGRRLPGDGWIAALRIHYRVDGGDLAGADSAALACTADRAWCAALTGYTAHVLGESERADFAFALALSAMGPDDACAWRDIAPLLPPGVRKRYESLSCEARPPVEARYWLLSRPTLDGDAHRWRSEYYSRRVLVLIAERSATPQSMPWGRDAAELLLRYGWPRAWSRAQQSSLAMGETSIVGHDPSPSFAFAPREELLDSLVPAGDAAWELGARIAPARYAPRLVRRTTAVAAQLARFRRGDSTLLVAAFAAAHDSLRSPVARLGAARADGRVVSTDPLESLTGTLRLMLPAAPVLAGVDVADSTTHTLARTRVVTAPLGGGDLALSDLLVYRAGPAAAAELGDALSRAVRGDTVSRTAPLAVFWEVYGARGEALEMAVVVERVDRSGWRAVRQRLGLADADSPLRITWSDARRVVDGVAAQSLSLDLGNLPRGRYRLTITAARADGVRATAARELELGEG